MFGLFCAATILLVAVRHAGASNACGHTNVSGLVGIITSPGYPSNYYAPNGTGSKNCTTRVALKHGCRSCYSECSWTISVPPGLVVRFVVTDMQFDRTLNIACRNLIEVFDGTSPSVPTAIAGLVGTGRSDVMTSTGNNLYIRMVSSHDAPWRSSHRFNASWTAECFKEFTGSVGNITSLNFPRSYPTNLVCSYVINQPDGFKVTVNFINIGLDPVVNNNCPSSDHVTVYDGDSIKSAILGGPYCQGSILPIKLSSTQNKVLIKFRSDSITGSSALGFLLNYTQISPECNPLEIITLKKSKSTGIISSPAYPRRFSLERNCSWLIKAESGRYVVQLKLKSIELGAYTGTNDAPDNTGCDRSSVTSELLVYSGGTDDSSKLIARYCNRNIIPHTIISTEREMLIQFRSKKLQNVRWWTMQELGISVNGFQATYSQEGKKYNTDTEPVLDMISYGTGSLDCNLKKTSNYNLEPEVIKLPSAIPVENRLFNYVVIFQTGKVAFSQRKNEPWILSNHWKQNSCLKRSYDHICGYCSNINAEDKESTVYYHLYNKSHENAVQDVNRLINQFKGTNDFNASITFVASWHKVRQNKEGRIGADNGFATFQVAIAASQTDSYFIMQYRRNHMLWDFTQTGDPYIFSGITTKTRKDGRNDTKPKCQDFFMSNTRKMLRLDDHPGNMGVKGLWVFKLGDTGSGAEYECNDWYNRNLKLNSILQNYFGSLPKCPCQLSELRVQGIWLYSHEKQALGNADTKFNCYRLTRGASETYFPAGKECCYDSTAPNQLVEMQPDAGTATAYNPAYPDNYQSYLKEDLLGHDACCVRANSSQYCRQYYELRPIGNCSTVVSNVQTNAWFLGDPHIMTLDEGNYIFNGWGEYIMYELETLLITSTMQARTDRMEIDPGHYSSGTIFTAFGAKEGDAVVFVQLDPNTNDTFIIYGNGVDLSKKFQQDEHFVVDELEYSLQRSNFSLRLVFPSGIAIEFSIRVRSLAVSVAIPATHKGLMRGLLGNYNGRKDDDFILPNGTSLGANLTEREIFEKFGPAWAVTAQNTIMRYGQGKNVSTYSHPEFVPQFLDEQPETVQNAGRALCGNNTACMYDYFATGSAAFAVDTREAKEAADLENSLLKNSMPHVKTPKRIEVTSGVVETFTLTANDPDGDLVTYHAEDSHEGTISVHSTTGLVHYTPALSNTATLRFFARDSKQVASVSQVVEVYVCSGCSGHGRCDYNSVIQDLSYYVHHVECVCSPAWTGDDCEQDVNGCLGNPCVEGQTCRDLSPQEQGSSVIGFDCGACPPGYTKDGAVCSDIDECQSNNGGCQMSCSNTQGSFQCGCGAGYRLGIDGRQCQDIDECTEGHGDCDQRCLNTQGSYKCHCVEGYSYDAARRMCIQETSLAQECRFSDCSQGCKRTTDLNATQGLECFCFAGFENATEDHSECVDRDECLDRVCGQRCFNMPGGFFCGCHSGYRMSGDGTSCLPCTDLTYGPECQYHCRCSGHGTRCDPVTGCVCEAGWTGAQCEEEVDECTETPHVCGPDKVCRNTPGSYLCNCLAGYTKDQSGSCIDINECQNLSLLNTCVYPQICTNIPGSFYCSCPRGYSIDNSGNCQDINECSLNISTCQQQCENVDGSYNCDCYPGYILSSDRSTCRRVEDVCSGINCSHGCRRNEDGNNVCFCDIGFTLGSDQTSCLRTVTCSTAECSHTCQTIDDKPVCECPVGMKLDNNLKTCIACFPGTFGINCGSNCSCGVGAERCDVSTGCVCRGGWSGARCDQDVDECSTAAVQQECRTNNAACINNPGSYQCLCRDGFATDSNGVCQDIDECKIVTSPCSQKCENVPGSYRCLCSQGFSYDIATKTCEDIDECKWNITNNCDQLCINTEGFYRCACNRPGYTLSGNRMTCTATTNCTRKDCPTEHGGCTVDVTEKCFCNSGYKLSADGTHCIQIDVDWCSVKGLCEHDCQETADGNSFVCSCHSGFLLNDDKRTCRENATISGCKRSDCPKNDGGCVNETCVCNNGFHLTASGTCENTDTNWCSIAMCEHGCELTSNGAPYVCTCRDGYILNSDNRTCRPENAAISGCKRTDCPKNDGGCVNETCFCNSGFHLTAFGSCENTDTNWCSIAMCEHGCELMSNGASYVCSCRDGYVLNSDKRTCRPAQTGNCSTAGCEQLCQATPAQTSFTCSCIRGFVLNIDKKSCRELHKINLVMRVDIQISGSPAELTDKTSPVFFQLSKAVIQELNSSFLSTEKGFVDIRVDNLRVGSLIIDWTIWVDNVVQPDVLFSIAPVLIRMVKEPLLIQGQSGMVLYFSVDSKEVGIDTTVCDVLNILTACPSGQHCVVDSQKPVCRQKDYSGHNYNVGLGIGIGLGLLLLVSLIVAGYWLYKKKQNKPRPSVPSDNMSSKILQEAESPYSKLEGSWTDLRDSNYLTLASSNAGFDSPQRLASPAVIFIRRPSTASLSTHDSVVFPHGVSAEASN